jgi:hypothetical protein
MEMLQFGGIMFFVVLISTVALAVAVKVIINMFKGGKAAAGGAESIIAEVGQEVQHVVSGVSGSVRLVTHGQLFDRAESLGGELVGGGYLTDAEWQPIFEKIATGLTKAKAKAPATEAVAAT